MSFSRGRPPRLPVIFQQYDLPIYFVTLCARDRTNTLAHQQVHERFLEFARRGHADKGIAVGRYVIMPDHIHLFVRLPQSIRLTEWGRGLKRAISTLFPNAREIWQRGFFDHLLRGNESYAEKSEYVRMNPVRAGLAQNPDEWPYQGYVVTIGDVRSRA